MKPYPKYKTAGVRWIDKIPDDWYVNPLFAVLKERGESNKGNIESNVLSLSYGKIIQRDLSQNFGLLPESFETYQVVYPGDIILRLTDLQNDKKSLRVGQVNEKGIITSAYTCLKSTSEILPKYAFYLLHSYDLMKVFYNEGAGVRQSMTFKELRRMPILIPSVPEQQVIADYLDQKTAQIDSFITKKQRLIELLQEQWSVIINQAVTKGLNPSVSMKETGNDWIGEIPSHWKISKLKYLGTAIIGLTYSPEQITEEGKGTLILRASNINNGRIVLEDNVYVNSHIPNHLKTLVGDILICSRSGSRKLIGKNAIIDEKHTGFSFGVFMTVFRGQRNNYLYYVFNSQIFKYQSGLFGTATINQLTLSNLNNFQVPFPPLDEQNEIIDYLKKKTSEIDILIVRNKYEIELLKEFRDTLIVSVVTGKIDVRESL